MGRSRGKRARGRRHVAPAHHGTAAAGVESDPDFEVDSEESELNLDEDQVKQQVQEIEENPKPKEEEENLQEQEQVASAPEQQLELTSTFSSVQMEEPKIVPMIMGDHEFKIAMSRVQLEPDNFIWAVKLVLDDCDMDCRCQFHQQMRRANDVIRENSV